MPPKNSHHRQSQHQAVIPDIYELFWDAVNSVEEDHSDTADVLEIIEAVREAIHDNQGRATKVAHVMQCRVRFVLSEIGRKFANMAEEQAIPRGWLKR